MECAHARYLIDGVPILGLSNAELTSIAIHIETCRPCRKVAEKAGDRAWTERELKQLARKYCKILLDPELMWLIHETVPHVANLIQMKIVELRSAVAGTSCVLIAEGDDGSEDRPPNQRKE